MGDLLHILHADQRRINGEPPFADLATGSEMSRVYELTATLGETRQKLGEAETEIARLRNLIRERDRIAAAQSGRTIFGHIKAINFYAFGEWSRVLAAISAHLIDGGMDKESGIIDCLDAAADCLNDAQLQHDHALEDAQEARLQAQTEPLARAQGVL